MIPSCIQIILAREYLKDVSISRDQVKYLVMEALRGGCQVSVFETLLRFPQKLSLTIRKIIYSLVKWYGTFILYWLIRL